MTREEAIAFFRDMNECTYGNLEAVNMAIKALEQQLVLDKIRAEIRHFMFEINPSSSESDYACNYMLDIIDKYKAESEDKE